MLNLVAMSVHIECRVPKVCANRMQGDENWLSKAMLSRSLT